MGMVVQRLAIYCPHASANNPTCATLTPAYTNVAGSREVFQLVGHLSAGTGREVEILHLVDFADRRRSNTALNCDDSWNTCP